jgi:secondary thiamine-phosphate synthase enzyme
MRARSALRAQALHAGHAGTKTAFVAVYQEVFEVKTSGKGFVDFTRKLGTVVRESGIANGVCTLFVLHTSASLLIQENADPAVLRDLERWIGDLAPEGRVWEHSDEGPDDMPAHARAALTRTSESVIITHGKLALGTWQGIYLWEHRRSPHRRRVMVCIQGE